ncbi:MULTISPECIES: transporter [Hydrocarboniphaga]|uniref:Transporter n=2 Tax=Hydrocarboniphaga effusa TaxID=243629 RepID=I8TCM6_9GAMM|nr:transporter [Hydrocarboniphaga sp.]EIT71423.1 hypothetical protein WQQ_15600 [Hydrocarboniphaga effusa AP103]MDZ4079344.1 transporter [Hydrocarboniphaga sp.]
MMHKHTQKSLVAAALALMSASASAGVNFDAIGPHEYNLPAGGFEPFNVFVQYASVSDDDKAYDADGDKIDGPGTRTLVGISKYVRFWTPGWAPKIGLAYEILVPTIGVRDKAAGTQTSGIGDPLTGFAVWYKPNENATLGFQSFVHIPVGGEVSDTNWKSNTSFFWDFRLPAKFGFTGDAGYLYQTERVSGFKPGLSWFTNDRFGLRVSEHVEPFIGFDAEYQDGNDGAPHSWTIDGGVGVMFHTFKNQSITVRYSTTLDAVSRVENDSLNVRYIYSW